MGGQQHNVIASDKACSFTDREINATKWQVQKKERQNQELSEVG